MNCAHLTSCLAPAAGSCQIVHAVVQKWSKPLPAGTAQNLPAYRARALALCTAWIIGSTDSQFTEMRLCHRFPSECGTTTWPGPSTTSRHLCCLSSVCRLPWVLSQFRSRRQTSARFWKDAHGSWEKTAANDNLALLRKASQTLSPQPLSLFPGTGEILHQLKMTRLVSDCSGRN